MMNDGLGGNLSKWVGEINKLRGTYKDTGKRVPAFEVSDFVVTSGYRNPHHNFDHAGSTALLSAHMFGYALDVRGKALVDKKLLDIDGDRKNTDEDRADMKKAAENASARKAYTYPAKHVHADWAPSNWATRTSTAADPPVFKLPKAGNASPPSTTLQLVPSDGVYTASAGDSHTAQLPILSRGASISFYVITPNDARNDVSTYLSTASGDGTASAASVDYTFPSGISGDYTFYATIYYNDGTSSPPHPSYTVSVSASTTTTTTDTTTPTITLVSSDGVYTATAGNGHESNLTLSAAPSYVFWYVQGPGASSPTLQSQDTSGSLTSQLDYSFPSGVSGDYVISVSGTSASDFAAITASYTVTVSLPSSTTPSNSGNSGTESSDSTDSTPTVTLGPGAGYTSTGTVGGVYTLVATSSVPISMIKWYWQRPGETESRWDTQYFYDGATTSSVSFVSFDGTNPEEENVGEHVFRVEVTPVSALAEDPPLSVSYTVTVE